MWGLVQRLLLMYFWNVGHSLSKILASCGQSLAGPYFFHILVNMSFSSSLSVGLVLDLMLQRLWYLAAAVTDKDLERGLDRGSSWFVRLLDESSTFSGFRILSKWRFCNYMLSPLLANCFVHPMQKQECWRLWQSRNVPLPALSPDIWFVSIGRSRI